MSSEKLNWMCRKFGHKFVLHIKRNYNMDKVEITTFNYPFCKRCGKILSSQSLDSKSGGRK